MDPKEVRREVRRLKRLKRLKDEAFSQWLASKPEDANFDQKIYDAINSCSAKRGRKHAGGGGGLGGSLWVVCSGCGQEHHWDPRDKAQATEFNALPGKITFHSSGN